MSAQSYWIAAAVFFVLLLGAIYSHHRSAKKVDGATLLWVVILLLAVYLVAVGGLQRGQLQDTRARLSEAEKQVATAATGGLGITVALPTVGLAGVRVTERPLAPMGVVSIVVGLLCLLFGLVASARGDKGASHGLYVLGLFLVVAAIVVLLAG